MATAVSGLNRNFVGVSNCDYVGMELADILVHVISKPLGVDPMTSTASFDGGQFEVSNVRPYPPTAPRGPACCLAALASDISLNLPQAQMLDIELTLRRALNSRKGVATRTVAFGSEPASSSPPTKPVRDHTPAEGIGPHRHLPQLPVAQAPSTGFDSAQSFKEGIPPVANEPAAASTASSKNNDTPTRTRVRASTPPREAPTVSL